MNIVDDPFGGLYNDFVLLWKEVTCMNGPFKRVLSIALCLVLCLSLVPLSALAAEDPVHAVDSEGAVAESVLLSGEDPGSILFTEAEPVVYAPGGDDGAELLNGFARSRLDALRPAGAGLQNVKNLGGEFTGMMAAVYTYIRAEARKVADGERTSTAFEMAVDQLGLEKTSWTKEDLGTDIVVDNAITQAAIQAARATMNFDLGLQIDVLLADGPYDFYWYDKTVGTRMRGPS